MNSILLENRKNVISIFFQFMVVLVTSAQDQTAILAGKMLDVANGTFSENILIIVESDIIIDITSSDKKSNYSNFIDLSEYTIIPGLIDCHTHLTDNSYDTNYDPYTHPAATYGIIGTINAKKTLEAGFTTVRDLGGYYYSDIALRDAINDKLIAGPRMFVSGPYITTTGGHASWGNWMSPNLELRGDPSVIVDSPDEMRKQIRVHIKNNVDQIKLMATGGFGTSESIPGAATFTIEEMKAGVEEAKKRGLQVAAHAHGADGIKNAVKAGVASIEHASFLDSESIEMIKNRHIYLVMDLYSAYYDLIVLNRDYSDKKLSTNNSETYNEYAAKFTQAYKNNVNMAFGTDSGVYPHGDNAKQFNLMVKAGMNEIDVIRCATVNAAELIGIEKQAGTIEAGKWANIIAVKGNPLEDISVLESVDFVMKEGIIYKQAKQ